MSLLQLSSGQLAAAYLRSSQLRLPSLTGYKRSMLPSS
jgi:hypothetical protein